MRVWVNGSLVIDQWHAASGQTYTASLNLAGGQSYFQVEYYEATGNASIDFTHHADRRRSRTRSQPASPTGATATVTAYRLNVRAAPDPINGQIHHPHQPAGSLSGGRAQRRRHVVSAQRQRHATAGSPAATSTSSTARTSRWSTAPGSRSRRPGAERDRQHRHRHALQRRHPQRPRHAVPPSGAVPGRRRSLRSIGRNSNNTWWQINFNGLVGWVSAQFAIISPTANISAIPITG